MQTLKRITSKLLLTEEQPRKIKSIIINKGLVPEQAVREEFGDIAITFLTFIFHENLRMKQYNREEANCES